MQSNIKIRKHYKTQYTTIDNQLLNDMSISFKAKGVFIYFWSKPDDWELKPKAIANDWIDRQTAIYSALKELETAGYLYRKRYYINGKIAGIRYNLSDTKEFDQAILDTDNLDKEMPDEYIDIQNKDINKKKNIQNKDINKKNSNVEILKANDTEVLTRSTIRDSLKVEEGKQPEVKTRTEKLSIDNILAIPVPMYVDQKGWEAFVRYRFTGKNKKGVKFAPLTEKACQSIFRQISLILEKGYTCQEIFLTVMDEQNKWEGIKNEYFKSKNVIPSTTWQNARRSTAYQLDDIDLQLLEMDPDEVRKNEAAIEKSYSDAKRMRYTSNF